MEMDPEHPTAFENYVELIERLNFYHRAIDFLTTLSSKAEMTSELSSALGRIYAAIGLHGLASSAYGRLIGRTMSETKIRLIGWIRSGGPIPPLRRKIILLNKNTMTRWRYWAEGLTVLDTLDQPKGFETEMVRARVETYLERWAKSRIWQDSITTLARRIVFYGGMFIVWSMLFWRIHHSYSNSIYARILVTSLTLIAAFLVRQIIAAVAGHGSNRSQLVRGLAACGLSIGCGLSIIDTAHPSQWVIYSFGYALIAGVAIALAMVAVLASINIVFSISLNKLRQQWPREVVLDYLCDVVHDLESGENRNDLNWRSEAIWGIEYAARRMERDLPRFFEVGDSQTSEWLASRAKGAATALRNCKRHILVSDTGTWNRLSVTLRGEISALATGNWASLKWSPPPPREATIKSVQKTAYLVLRTAFVMAVPLVALITLNFFLDLAPKTYSAARIVSVVWAILYFLLTIDPTLPNKVETVKSIVGTVREAKLDSSTSGENR